MPVSRICLLVIAVFATASDSLATEKIELRLLSSWSPAYIARPEVAGRFIEQVARSTNGRINISVLGPGAIPPFEQLEPVAAGLVELLFTHGAYHLGETGIGMALDAIDPDPLVRRDTGLWEKVASHYASLGLMLLSLPTSPQGYHMLLRDPITTECDLRGRKIRGSPVYHGLLAALGAVPVVLPAGEIYAALEKKVIDGAAWPAAGSLPFRWYEVTNYFMRPTFGATTHLILMNLQRYKALPTDLQQILLDEGNALERHTFERFAGLVGQEAIAFIKHGLQATELCGTARQQLNAYWADGVWSLVELKDGYKGTELRELAEKSGITPPRSTP